jgi:hypothetical protein
MEWELKKAMRLALDWSMPETDCKLFTDAVFIPLVLIVWDFWPRLGPS